MEKFKIKRKVTIEEDVSFNMFVAIKVSELRKGANLSQEGLAKRIGLTRTSIVNIENGKQLLTMKNLYLICKEFNVKSKDILPF